MTRHALPVTSLHDLTIIEDWDPVTNKANYITVYLITPDEEVFFGQSSKDKRDMTLEEYSSALEHVKDNEIYPKIPENTTLTVASDSLDDNTAFIKRPGLSRYDLVKETDFVPPEVLNESLIMEKVSKLHHPNIIGCHGCRVRRGRITGIVLELLDQTLAQYALEFSTSGASWNLDPDRFIAALESAVDALHSLGLAHNDINPQISW
jgi:serine/threonine protein kinase